MTKKQPDWIGRGKTARSLIEELQSFEGKNQFLKIQISYENGEQNKSLDALKNQGDFYLLIHGVGCSKNECQKKELNSPEDAQLPKIVAELIECLSVLENLDSEVRISLDGGLTHRPISLVGKSGFFCVLSNCE